jgi:hypothetical protein
LASTSLDRLDNQKEIIMNIKDVFPSLGMYLGPSDDRNPSATKKGPGRKHKEGAHKGKRTSSAFKRAAVKKAKVQQQTDNVTNTPLKAATRGG